MRCAHTIPAAGGKGGVLRCNLDAVEGQLYCRVHLARHPRTEVVDTGEDISQ